MGRKISVEVFVDSDKVLRNIYNTTSWVDELDFDYDSGSVRVVYENDEGKIVEGVVTAEQLVRAYCDLVDDGWGFDVPLWDEDEEFSASGYGLDGDAVLQQALMGAVVYG